LCRAAEKEVIEGCAVDALEGCTLADLELMYVDALWSFYHPDTRGQFTLSDEDFDRLKDELYWQASGFPTLKREEIDFVEASIAYARGAPVVSDAEYEVLKKKVASLGEKRADVTALLLYTKGQQLLEPDEYEALSSEMKKLGIEVGLKGATCTLNNTTDELEVDTDTLLKMYAGLGAIPTTIGFSSTLLASLMFNGPQITLASFTVSLLIGAGLTYTLTRYLDLHNTTILKGKCPCCEKEMKQLFSGDSPAPSMIQKCSVCGTTCELSREDKKMKLASGPEYVSV